MLLTSFKQGSFFINFFLSLTFLFITLGQLGRIDMFEIPAFINLYEVFLGITLLLLVIKLKISKEIVANPLFKVILMFFSWLGITLLTSLFYYSFVQNILAVLYFFRLVFYFAFFIYIFGYIQKYPKTSSYFKMCILIFSIIILLTSFVQFTLYPNIGNLAYQGWDPHLYRLVGLFFDPPITASIFFLLSLFLLYSYKNWYIKVFLMSAFSILFFLTYSRGGYLALLSVLALYSARKMNAKILLSFILVIVLLFVVLPKNSGEGLNLARTSSIKTRFIDYQKAFSIWQKNPVLGIGYNHIRAEKDVYEEEPIFEEYNPSHASASFHSSFLIILVTSGIIGLGIFLILIWKLAIISDFTLYALSFLSVYSLTDNVLLHPFILFTLFVLISIQSSISRLSRT